MTTRAKYARLAIPRYTAFQCTATRYAALSCIEERGVIECGRSAIECDESPPTSLAAAGGLFVILGAV
jgi:hypothetical protein